MRLNFRAFLFTLLLAQPVWAGRVVAVHCLAKDIDLIFATTLTNGESTIKRTYDYDSVTTYIVSIPTVDTGYIMSDLSVKKNGVLTKYTALCSITE